MTGLHVFVFVINYHYLIYLFGDVEGPYVYLNYPFEMIYKSRKDNKTEVLSGIHVLNVCIQMPHIYISFHIVCKNMDIRLKFDLKLITRLTIII